MPETGGSTLSASPGEYPDPRLEPFLGFALAAEAGVQHLQGQLGMDLWLVTHLEHDELVVVASATHGVAVDAAGRAARFEQPAGGGTGLRRLGAR